MWTPAAHCLAAVFIQRQRDVHTAPRFTKHVFSRQQIQVYVPSGNSTCVTDMAFHRGGAEHWSSNAILPGHNRGKLQWNARHTDLTNEEPSCVCEHAPAGGTDQSQPLPAQEVFYP